MVTMVLLNVALMWATPRLTLRRCLRFLLLATVVVPVISKDQAARMKDESRRPGLLLSPFILRPSSLKGSIYFPASLTPFLPATVFRGPLRVRALVRVRWPRTGRWRR